MRVPNREKFRCLRHVRPSVCPHVLALLSMEGFSKNLVLGKLYDNMSRNQIWLRMDKTCVLLHGELLTFRGCRQRKFAITAPLYHNTQYFSIAASNIAEKHTLKVVFRVHTATFLTRSRHKLPLILLSSLTL